MSTKKLIFSVPFETQLFWIFSAYLGAGNAMKKKRRKIIKNPWLRHVTFLQKCHFLKKSYMLESGVFDDFSTFFFMEFPAPKWALKELIFSVLFETQLLWIFRACLGARNVMKINVENSSKITDSSMSNFFKYGVFWTKVTCLSQWFLMSFWPFFHGIFCP